MLGCPNFLLWFPYVMIVCYIEAYDSASEGIRQ